MPDLVFRLLGYGGLAAVIAARLLADGGWQPWLCLGVTVAWPGIWWWLVRRHPGLRSTATAASRLAFAAECLMVRGVAVAARFDRLLTVGIGLAILTCV
ncbi:MAG: hypothetical protein P8Y69_18420, partial [Gammaproteobacteria bacterium]